MTSIFVSLIAFALIQGNAWAQVEECQPCPTTVNTTPQCGTSTVSEIPFTYHCGDITDRQKLIPLSPSSACTFANPNQINTTISCKHNVQVSCEPCCGPPCPAHEARVTGHGG